MVKNKTIRYAYNGAFLDLGPSMSLILTIIVLLLV